MTSAGQNFGHESARSFSSRGSVRHDVSRDLGTSLVNDMQQTLSFFNYDPMKTHMQETEASAFHN